MHIFSALKIVFLFKLFYVFAQILDDVPGKVFIGSAENDTTANYSFSVNQPSSEYRIPVYFDIYNDSTQVNAVVVTCGTSPAASGYSSAVFVPQTISISNPSSGPPYFGSVSFNGSVVGRTTDVRCWCTSPPPFTKEVTISDAKQFTVIPPGVVNLYSSVYRMGQPVYVKLSQVVQQNSVEVTCQGGGFVFSSKTVPVGSRVTEIPYSTLNNVSAAVNISCRGQSANNGYQFLRDNSNGLGAVVVKYESVVSLLPSQTTLNRIRMPAILSINQVPTDTVMFSCSVSMVYSWGEVMNITEQVGCSATPRPTPGPDSTGIFTLSGNESTVVTTARAMTTTIVPTTATSFDTTAGNTSIPVSPTSPTPTNLTGYWIVQPTDFAFSVNDPKSYLFRTLELYRTAEVTALTEELVVTRCCSAEPTTNNPYFNTATSMVAAVVLTPTVYINWTIATATANMSVETPIVNPAFKNLAPCPCNLTANACDANCCCDTDCTEADIAVFQCIEGVFGGMEGEKSHDFCGTRYYDTPGWFPIMCIHKENNGFLGNFFYPAGLIRNQTAFDATLAPHSSDYSFRQNQAILPGEPNGSQVGYKEGLAIKTGLQIPPATFQIGPNYMLTLPQQGIHGQPIWSAPVRFLVDTDAFWVQNMSQSTVLCTGNSPLSALMYVQSPTWGTAVGPMVLKEQGIAVVTSINVNFLCDSDASKYLASRVTYNDLVLSNVTKLFGTASDEANDCRFDNVTGAYVCGNYSVGGTPSESTLPPRCSWDDGYTAPPQPILSSNSKTCDNAVVRVLYNFTWSGQSVLYLNATLILAPVSLTTTAENASGAVDERPAVLSQQFMTKFVSQRVDSSTASGEDEGMMVTPVSGNPGYNMNLPVISGISVMENETSGLLYIDMNSSSRLSLWNPGVGSLCEGASKMPVPFGVGTMAECVLRLNFANLENCDLLRRQVLSGQDSLMPSNYISLVGNPNAGNLSNWTNIIREDVSYIINSSRDSNALSTEQTTQTTQTTTALYSVPPSYNYYSEVKGSCNNIPSGINLQIMYALAGRSNYQPIHRIVGAKISYTLSTWRWNCAGVNGASCRSNSTLVQSFALTSTVSFIQVPPTPQPEPTRYQKRSYIPAHICKDDDCWSQIFYPFMKINEHDNQQHTIALGLAFLIFIIYFTFITSSFLGEVLKLCHEF